MELAPAPAPAWTSPSLLDLLPDLSDEEKERLRLQVILPEPEDIASSRSKPGPVRVGLRREEASIISTVRNVLDHYNARHPGDEFDVVKPLMRDSLHFRGQVWLHMNFWARSRSNRKIQRFFAEVHYKPSPCSDPSLPGSCDTIVESCTIIEEPLARYRTSCGFCAGYLDILHPRDDEFVCGNGNAKDWTVEKLFGMRFISCRDPAYPNSQGERRGDLPQEKGSVEDPWLSLLDLLPELSAEEKAWCEGDVIPWSPTYLAPCVGKDDKSIIPTVCDVLDHYNARHPGDEFDAVKPLTQDGLHFRKEPGVVTHELMGSQRQQQKDKALLC